MKTYTMDEINNLPGDFLAVKQNAEKDFTPEKIDELVKKEYSLKGMLDFAQKITPPGIKSAFGVMGEVVKSTIRPLAQPFVNLQAEIADDFAPKDIPLLGKVQPMSAQPGQGASTPQILGEAANTALLSEQPVKILGKAVAPIAKMARPLIEKSIKGLVVKAGEVLTAIEKPVLKRWMTKAEQSPEELNRIKDYVKKYPDEPYKGLVDDIAENLNSFKKTARESFDTGIANFKKKYPDATFNLLNRVQDIGKAIAPFGLKIKNGIVSIGNRASPFTTKGKDVAMIQDIVDKMQLKDMTVDELLSLDKSIRNFFDYAAKNEDKTLMALGYGMTKDSTKWIDELIPDVNVANKIYSQYYKMMEDFGGKIVDSAGVVKTGAETFVGNVNNFNKGVQRKNIDKARKMLGIDILDSSQSINDARRLMEAIPSTVKNRFMDFLRASTAGTAGMGIVLQDPKAMLMAIPAMILHLYSSPKRYAGLIEILPKMLEKGKFIPSEEVNLLLRRAVADFFQGTEVEK